MKVNIRPASYEDAEELASIISRSFATVAERYDLTKEIAPTHPSNCTPDWIETALRKGIYYYLLEENGRAIGCAAMEKAGDNVCYLERLAVLPEFRKTGYGRTLVEHVIKEAAGLGINRIEIAIISWQTDLREWYEKQGFIISGTKSFDHLPFDVIFMYLQK